MVPLDARSARPRRTERSGPLSGASHGEGLSLRRARRQPSEQGARPSAGPVPAAPGFRSRPRVGVVGLLVRSCTGGPGSARPGCVAADRKVFPAAYIWLTGEALTRGLMSNTKTMETIARLAKLLKMILSGAARARYVAYTPYA